MVSGRQSSTIPKSTNFMNTKILWFFFTIIKLDESRCTTCRYNRSIGTKCDKTRQQCNNNLRGIHCNLLSNDLVDYFVYHVDRRHTNRYTIPIHCLTYRIDLTHWASYLLLRGFRNYYFLYTKPHLRDNCFRHICNLYSYCRREPQIPILLLLEDGISFL